MTTISGYLVREREWTIRKHENCFWVRVIVKTPTKEVRIAGNCTKKPQRFDTICVKDAEYDPQYRQYTTKWFVLSGPSTPRHISSRLFCLGFDVPSSTIKDVDWSNIVLGEIPGLPTEVAQSIKQALSNNDDGDASAGEYDNIVAMMGELKLPWGFHIIKSIADSNLTSHDVMEDPLSLLAVDGIGIKKVYEFINAMPEDQATKTKLQKQVDVKQMIDSGGHMGLPINLVDPLAIDGITLVEHNGYVYWAKDLEIEQELASRLAALRSKTYDFCVKDSDVEGLTTEQETAVRKALQCGLSCISGGPGTGKSHCAGTIIKTLYNVHPFSKILMVAFAGKAVLRLKSLVDNLEVWTEPDISTIHRFIHSKNVYNNYNLVIVDEAGMVDTRLLHEFLTRVHTQRIVLMGDTNQLPPIAGGDPFKKIFKSGVVPRTTLKQVQRQKADSSLHKAIQSVRVGKWPRQGDDFIFLATDTQRYSEVLRRTIKDLLDSGTIFENILVMVPTNKLVDSLQSLVREVVIGDHERESTSFFVGDKKIVIYEGDTVMNVKNIYEETGDVFNGDTGIVENIGTIATNEKIGTVEFVSVRFENGNFVYYNRTSSHKKAKDDVQTYLRPAFVSTVHKNQGSEKDVAIVIVDTSIVSTRNMLYTAISRAKRKCIVIGSHHAMDTCLANTCKPRFGLLDVMIKEML